jgi:hypothetical protein
MQEIIAHSSLQQLSYYYVNVKYLLCKSFKTDTYSFSSSVEWSTVETDVTYINKYLKNL